MGSMKDTTDPLVASIEKRAKAENITMTGVLRAAKVGRASWWRWRKGRPAQLDKVRAVEAALNGQIAILEMVRR